jgi:4-amino-4-deoxy-L-arabinose transferase-like glycosyltransferase
MLFAFGSHLALGIRTPLDADEATLALTALHVTQGQLALMEPNGQYLGALDAYVVAPFIIVFGANAVAVRLALATVGAVYVLTVYWLGRVLFRRYDYALSAAIVAAAFPAFGVYWAIKLRGGYAELPVFETLGLGLCALIGWRDPRLRWWALLGFASGVALWSDLLFLLVFAVIALALLLRGSVIGWRRFRGGLFVAALGGVVGLTPWLAFNLSNNLRSLHAIPKNHIGFQQGVSYLLNEQLPIFVGGSSDCGSDIAPRVVTDAALGVFLLALAWKRRGTLRNLVTGRFSAFEPIDVALFIIPITLALLVVSRNNFAECEPRYLMALTVPLVVGATALLIVRWPWRSFAIACAAVWLAVSAVASAGQLVDQRSYTPGGLIPSDLGPGLAVIQRENPNAIWAHYWLSRTLLFQSRDTLPIGEYGGYVAFPQKQAAVATAINPSWVFVQGDIGSHSFERFCADHHVTYYKLTGGGLALYTHLTVTLEPGDVFGRGT